MAAAVTSGVVALMLDASRDLYEAQLTPNAVKAILEYTAIPLTGVNPLTQGTGSLNGAGAVLLAQKVDPGRPIGQWWLTGGVQPVTVIAGQSLGWARAGIWNNRLVSGDVVFVNRAAWSQSSEWGDTVVWGTGDGGDTVVWGTAGDTVVWGTTDLVWGDPSVWSHTVVWGTGLLGTTDGSGVLGPTTVVWGTVQLPE